MAYEWKERVTVYLTRYRRLFLAKASGLLFFAIILCFCRSLSGSNTSMSTMNTANMDLYRIFRGGKEIGLERYKMTSKDDSKLLRSEAIIEMVHGKYKYVSDFNSVLSMDSHGNPSYYSLSGKIRNQSVDFSIQFTKNLAISNGKKVQIHYDSLVVLDNLLTSHYASLISKFDYYKKDKYNFFAFIPQIMMEIPGSVEYKGKEVYEYYGKPFELTKLEVIVGSRFMELFLDAGNRIIRFVIPSQHLEIIRDGYRPSQTKPPQQNQISKAEGIFEEEVVFQSANIRMSGAITGPSLHNDNLLPGALFISGSGKQDRDGKTLDLTVDLHSKNIAYSLSASGYICFRYDDRGVGLSKDYRESVSFSDDILDAHSALSYLRSRRGVNDKKIFLIGHSAGAIIALALAADHPNIAGVILMAAPAKPLKDILVDQLIAIQRLNNATKKQINLALEHQKSFFFFIKGYQKGQTVPERFSIYKDSMMWFKELLFFDPMKVLEQVGCPILILQGEKDIQIGPENAVLLSDRLSEFGHTSHRVKIFPNLDHLFMKSVDGNIARYFDKSRSISVEVIEYMRDWLDKQYQ